MLRRHRIAIALIVVLAGIVALAAAAAWRSAIPGLSSARREPPATEVSVATWLLHKSVPPAMREQVNPLGGDPADITAGRDLFRQKCEICHGYDGSGKTEIGAAEYPRPPALRSMQVTALTDGEVFYHIRNGIRNTGMPAWSMPDAQIWQLVAYLRNLPKVASLSPEPPVASTETKSAHYVGSSACRSCHTAIFDRWSKTLMANVVRDPKQHPDAIIPDLAKTDPLVTFNKDDIAFVYGSKWKQRYFTNN